MFIKQNSFKKLVIWLIFTIHSDMKPSNTKKQVTTQKNKVIRSMIKSVINIPILKRNPTSRWVDFKTTINWMGAPKIYTCPSLSRGNNKGGIFFQNTWIKGYHIFIWFVENLSLMYQNITIHYSHISEQYTPYITISQRNSYISKMDIKYMFPIIL